MRLLCNICASDRFLSVTNCCCALCVKKFWRPNRSRNLTWTASCSHTWSRSCEQRPRLTLRRCCASCTGRAWIADAERVEESTPMSHSSSVAIALAKKSRPNASNSSTSPFESPTISPVFPPATTSPLTLASAKHSCPLSSSSPASCPAASTPPSSPSLASAKH